MKDPVPQLFKKILKKKHFLSSIECILIETPPIGKEIHFDHFLVQNKWFYKKGIMKTEKKRDSAIARNNLCGTDVNRENIYTPPLKS